MTIIELLKDLHRQSTVERSHYYTGSVILKAIKHIEQCERIIAENCDPADMTLSDATTWQKINKRVHPENYLK